MRPLTEEIAAFLRGGVSVFAATRDAHLQPRLSRAAALAVGPDRTVVTVYVPVRAGAELLEVAVPGAPLAVTATEVPTHRSVQLKGTITTVRPAADNERSWVETQSGGFTLDLGGYGFPLPVVRRFVTWPATAIELRVAATFVQTPGPGAGQPT